LTDQDNVLEFLYYIEIMAFLITPVLYRLHEMMERWNHGLFTCLPRRLMSWFFSGFWA
jgi:hypothetical protein